VTTLAWFTDDGNARTVIGREGQNFAPPASLSRPAQAIPKPAQESFNRVSHGRPTINARPTLLAKPRGIELVMAKALSIRPQA